MNTDNHQTATEQQLLTALRNLQEAVDQIRLSEEKPNLIPMFQEIDQLTRRLPRNTSPELLHFLHKKSYEKARMWLEGQQDETPRGNCRH